MKAAAAEPGVKKTGLHDMIYGRGHSTVVIRGSTATECVKLITDLLEKVTYDEMGKITIVFMWNVDNFPKWTAESLSEAIRAFDILGGVIASEVFTLV